MKKNDQINLKKAFVLTISLFVFVTSCGKDDAVAEEQAVIEEIEKTTPEPEQPQPETPDPEVPEPDPQPEPVGEMPEPSQSDEDIGAYTTCTPEGQNTVRTKDISNPVNVGSADDRSCYADYKESMINDKVWGVYNITAGSNHMDTNGLQPRIERSLSRSQTNTVGSYARFTGVVRILETGKTNRDSDDGTYIMQAKGKHTGGGGSADPAICLYLAKPVYGTDSEGNQVQVSFNIFREQINFRGGSGSVGRDIVFLKNVAKNVETEIVLEVGFRADPNDPTKKIHYADAIIGGTAFNWNIPEPEKGTQSGIRYGAYRVKGGRAQIRWRNTTYNKVEK